VQATSRGQGSPPAGPPVALNIVVGHATACRACRVSPHGFRIPCNCRIPG
jgi:hypothetical protein